MTRGAALPWDVPVLVAPMAGGPSTPELVAAAASAGALGFVPAGYKHAAQLEADLQAVRALTPRPFGVNVFVPGARTPEPDAVADYTRTLEPDAAALGVAPGTPRWDDDDWDAKVELLVDPAPAVVSFAFGCPPSNVVLALHDRDCIVMVTITDPDEAVAATEVGADIVCAQGFEAGAHRSTFDDRAPDRELPTIDLLAAVTARVSVPVVAAGGIATPDGVVAALSAGATAVQVGTAFLRCDEAGTNPTHRAALADERCHATAMTRAFTGRRARGLVNDFMRRHPDAPSAYPEIHHATRPLRTAAAAQGDAERLHLWAGTGYRDTRAGPAASIVEWLTGG